MTKIYYHVASSEYQEGDSLLAKDKLEEAGITAGWKWEDAEAGFDTDVVCVFDSLEEARLYKQDFAPSGKILEIEVAREDLEDPIAWQTKWGFYITPKTTRVAEGYTAFRDGIPAEWIKREVK